MIGYAELVKSFEVNFDGIVGPTHNYAGLSFGNVASMTHQSARSNPKRAALQGLSKMEALMKRGLVQAVLPPQERPYFEIWRRLGFSGNDKQVFESAFQHSPELFLKAYSASAMWTANAMTMAPRSDTEDSKTHFVAANLSNKLHRSLESAATEKVLKTIFREPKFFQHHPPLPTLSFLGDEGAANHTRFCSHSELPGLHLFVFGGSKVRGDLVQAKKFPARQSYEASEAVAKLLRIKSSHVILLQQNPEAIDAGVFHNDVISVGNQNFFMVHEKAFVSQPEALSRLTEMASDLGIDLKIQSVGEEAVSLKEAVQTYLFNSQILSDPKRPGRMILCAPEECRESLSVSSFIQSMLQDTNCPLEEVLYLNLRESMRNGGGPACLRNRVVLAEEELQVLSGRVVLDADLLVQLRSWVERHYTEELDFELLKDFAFVERCRSALEELTEILQLGAIYPFQSA